VKNVNRPGCFPRPHSVEPEPCSEIGHRISDPLHPPARTNDLLVSAYDPQPWGHRPAFVLSGSGPIATHDSAVLELGLKLGGPRIERTTPAR